MNEYIIGGTSYGRKYHAIPIKNITGGAWNRYHTGGLALCGQYCDWSTPYETPNHPLKVDCKRCKSNLDAPQ